jgi:DhnA family fructose-bisphosphate aldolase class Ia
VHRIPFIVKMNHNDLLRYPNTYDQQIFASVQQAVDLGAVGVGATVYFGSPEGRFTRSKRFAQGLRRGAPPRALHRAVVLPAKRRLRHRTASTIK